MEVFAIWFEECPLEFQRVMDQVLAVLVLSNATLMASLFLA
jgi:hypothetical protein